MIVCGECPQCFLVTPRDVLKESTYTNEFGVRVFDCPGCNNTFAANRGDVLGWTQVYFNDGELDEFRAMRDAEQG
jgi:hypothetical protein